MQQPHQTQNKRKEPEMDHENKKSPAMGAEKKREDKPGMDMQEAKGGQRHLEEREDKLRDGEKRR